MSSRASVQVYSTDESRDVVETVPTPAVFSAPIRQDVVHFVHSQIALNKRQARGIKFLAGMMHSAGSWGTGRALARIPRVHGSGTHRSGQGAFGNMCRDGRMFAPLRVWRKWQRKTNLKQKRHALASALAASAVAPLVMARGHEIESVPEIPLVVKDFTSVAKTKEMLKVLRNVGATPDLKRSEAKKLRIGKGKLRNRRYKIRRGPLLVISGSNEVARHAASNIPGVEVAEVSRLNLLKLAPGGHLGRFVIWDAESFKRLNEVFGSHEERSAQKKGYALGRAVLETADLGRLINSDQVQSVVRPAKEREHTHSKLKVNPLKNKEAMDRLNPYRAEARKLVQAEQDKRHKEKQGKMSAMLKKARAERAQKSKAFY